MNKHLNITITGKVQGVGFRFCTYEQLVDLGLQGKAENLKEGGVLVDVEGPEEKLAPLIQWCHQGPTGARVEKVEVQEMSEPFIPLKIS